MMRGPGFRQKSDMRRLWRCPACGTERKAPATVTVVRCGCVRPEPFMKLVETIRVVRPDLQAVNKYVTEEDLNALYGSEPVAEASPDAAETVAAVAVEAEDESAPLADGETEMDESANDESDTIAP